MVTEFAEMGKLFVSWTDTRTRLQTFGETSPFWCSLLCWCLFWCSLFCWCLFWCSFFCWCLRASLHLQEVWCNLTKARTCLLKFPELELHLKLGSCFTQIRGTRCKDYGGSARYQPHQCHLKTSPTFTLPPTFKSLSLLFKPLRDRLPALMFRPVTDLVT